MEKVTVEGTRYVLVDDNSEIFKGRISGVEAMGCIGCDLFRVYDEKNHLNRCIAGHDNRCIELGGKWKKEAGETR